MKLFNRIVAILNLVLFVTVAWTLVALTDWASARSILSAGPGWLIWWEPFVEIAAVLLIAVAGTLLVRDLSARLRSFLGAATKPDRIRIPAGAAGATHRTRAAR